MDMVAAERARRAKAGKRTKRVAAPETETMRTPPSKPERQFVDIDPWAVLLEGLMEIPEEKPVGRKGTKGK